MSSEQVFWILIQLSVLLIPVDMVLRAASVHLTLCEALLSVAFLMWIVQQRKKLSALHGNEFFLPVGLFILASALSVVGAENKFAAIRETIQFGWLFCVFIMLLNIIGQDGRSVRLAMLATASGTVVCLVAIYQYLFVHEPPDMLIAATRVRATGLYNQPNALGSYLIGVIPLLWSAALMRKLPDGFPKKLENRRVLLGVVTLYAAALTATFSRGSWIGVVAGLLVLGFLLWSRLDKKRFVTLIAVSAVGALAVLTDQSLQPEQKGRKFSNIQRFMLLEAGFHMFLDYPIFGVGSGNYPVRLREYAGEALQKTLRMDYDKERNEFYVNPRKSHDVELVHNIVLQVAVETGTVGLVTFVFLFAFYFKRAWSAIRAAFNEQGVMLRTGAFASLAAMLVAGIFGWPFTHGVQEILILNMAIVIGPSASNP